MNLREKMLSNKLFFVWSCLIPCLLAFLIFYYFPIVNTLYGSFHNWNALSGKYRFIGLTNYKQLLADPIVIKSLINTFNLTFWAVTIKTLLAFFIALGINSVARGSSFYRTIYFLPTIFTMVATAFVFKFLFQPDFGFINGVLAEFGGPQPGWLQDQHWSLATVIIYTIWKDMGYVFLIFLAGLQGISKELIEASEIDGAKGFKKVWSIIIPMIKPVIVFNVLTQIIGTLQIFTSIMIMTSDIASKATSGGPLYSTTTTGLYIYQKAFESYKFGYSSAIAFLFFLIIMIFTVVQLRINRTNWGY